jgi:hypothetical protein
MMDEVDPRTNLVNVVFFSSSTGSPDVLVMTNLFQIMRRAGGCQCRWIPLSKAQNQETSTPALTVLPCQCLRDDQDPMPRRRASGSREAEALHRHWGE